MLPLRRLEFALSHPVFECDQSLRPVVVFDCFSALAAARESRCDADRLAYRSHVSLPLVWFI